MRLQVLTLDGLPCQTIEFDGPVSGLCADGKMVAATQLEGSTAVSFFNTMAYAMGRDDE